MRIRDYFTFGRPEGTAVAIFLQSVPIFFALLPGSPPIIKWPFGQKIAVLVSSSVALLLAYALYRTIDQISQSLLSIEMQKRSNKLISVGLYSIVGLCSAIIAYLLFIFPTNVHVPVGLDDYTTGAAMGLLYSEYIALPQAVRIKASVNGEQRNQMISKFLSDIEKLQVESGSELDGVSESISELGDEIITEIEEEPISGKGSLHTYLKDWLADFDEARNLPQERKLVDPDEDNRIEYITNNLSALAQISGP
ncbi:MULTISPECIES: hypothetical protein [Halorussus]|uniref:hypothetical protein n=1 Tax=Halorussus TaxID=1070314 RepID=UPI0013B42B60|nr:MULTISPECIES: hypothetical protein [Halorussus]NHN59800.1 hypothetical protein [Halorussus sp. JP-T4]